jgi:peptidoglycan/xylan/chitin deacetylase (PgdA/CDA1 family)
MQKAVPLTRRGRATASDGPSLLVLLAILLALVWGPAARAADAQMQTFNTRFAAVAFHDVIDPGQPATDESVRIETLVGFFEWLKRDGWTVISPTDIDAAHRGAKSLPPKAILLTFDDGYASFHDRVYPLLLAYRYPALITLVVKWLEQPPGSMVDYGGTLVPREKFLSWDQVRRMRSSGLVEVASHSYALHVAVPINPQGNTGAAGRSWVYDRPSGKRETDKEYRARIRADLIRSREVIARETGVVPHVLAWPFGRFSGPAKEEAVAAGFDHLFTLEWEAADAHQLLEIPRYYPVDNPDLATIVSNLTFVSADAPTIRAVCIDLSGLASAQGRDEQDAVLGKMLEDVRRLGANTAIINALRFAPDGKTPVASWVPTSVLPVEADILSRAARQLENRAGVGVYVRLPLKSLVPLVGEAGAIRLGQDVARAALMRGLALDGDGDRERPSRQEFSLAENRAIRAAAGLDAPAALRVMRGAMDISPYLRLMMVADGQDVAGPPPGADMILLRPASDVRQAREQAARLKAAGWLKPGAADPILLSVPHSAPKDQATAIRAMQKEGTNAIALCPWQPADSEVLAPVFSAATFPRRP